MLFPVLIAISAAALFQMPPKKKAVLPEARKVIVPPRSNWRYVPGGTCSVPLLNAIPKPTVRMPMTPAPPEIDKMPPVKMPAPPCPEVRR